ncbi:mucoidy inhibitor MuiA family protein [Stieleria varia]|uniref:DUF4139 domain-containing protein n=1 Tax=Stieleria varia TaxID=2528005 RepID=A0A5C6AZK4_9BACT|nr:mucoidy inhibitor MuiA family protein [Stieleria varia]TWU05078.1 hypothetical protein Pla52n_31240 [Stieleria varia]
MITHTLGTTQNAFAATTCLMLCFFTATSAQISWSDDAVEKTVATKVVSATVYRDQARVQRSVVIEPSMEVQRIRCTGLPSALVADSVRVEDAHDIDLIGLHLDTHHAVLNPQIEEEKQAWADERRKLDTELRTAQQTESVVEQDLATLEKLVAFSAEKTRDDLNQARLDVGALTQLAEFTMSRRRELATELFQQQAKVQEISDAIERLESQPKPWLRSDAKETSDVILTVRSPGGGSLRLTYQVHNVSWVPVYKVFGTTASVKPGQNAGEPVRLAMDANVIQQSGEDWPMVKVTLAGTSPEYRTSHPQMVPLRISTADSESGLPTDNAFPTTVMPGLGTTNPMSWQQDAALNQMASHQQIAELSRASSVQRQIAPDADQDLADLQFSVPGELDLNCRATPHRLPVMEQALPTEMYRVVMPLLSSYAYHEARITNNSDIPLPGGDADVYLDGRFIGETTLEPTAPGQPMIVGFGSDRQVRTRRELLNRRESIQGGNRRYEMAFRLVVSNFHASPIDIRLFDRMPIAATDGSIDIQLTAEQTTNLSDDPLYLRLSRPAGILRWDMTIPAERHGANALDHHYTYSVEMDKQHSIVGNELADQIQSDLRFQNRNVGGGMGGGFGGGAF